MEPFGEGQVGAAVGDRQLVSGRKSLGAGEGEQLLHPPVRPAGGSQTAVPHRALGAGGRTPAHHPSQFPSPHKCRFHLALSIVSGRFPGLILF